MNTKKKENCDRGQFIDHKQSFTLTATIQLTFTDLSQSSNKIHDILD
jgi:hypothetical protein